MIYLGLVLIAAVAIYGLCKCTWWWPRWPRGVPSFLMLHSVSDAVVDASCPNNTIRPQELDALIVRLLRGGYRFRTFTDAASDPGPRDVVLTFDDGCVDNYVELLPILKHRGVPATCFVTSRFDDPRFLSPGQLREMDASGLVEIGGHTSRHCVLTAVDRTEAREQIRANKRDLESILGHSIVSFAYPCGGENDDIVAEVSGAGYRFAAAMVKKMRPVGTDPYRIHRQIIPRGKKTWQAYLLATRGKYKI
jgi:peptidoglycan/xylan/chitin deacetylase (PgdA/CDA1 family)